MTRADFQKDLAFSLDLVDEPFWSAVFKKAFPNMVSNVLCDDLALQRNGVDRVITLSSGGLIRIDQKLRRAEYSDIVLEFISVDRPKIKPGWIEKDLMIDYLAYGFLLSRRCYIFPWLLLRRAWMHYGDKWKSLYGIRETKNETYSTWWTPVPTKTLLDAIQTASIIQL